MLRFNERTQRAKLLLELRDSEKITFQDLCKRRNLERKNLNTITGRFYISLIKNLEILRDTGLINFKSQDSYSKEPQGEITVNRQLLSSIQHALDISLLHLSRFEPERDLVVTPFLGRPNEKKESELDIFVAMPFTEDLRPVFDDHIRKVVTDLNLGVVRADDVFSAQSVIAEMWSAIFNCRMVIADCTGRNPNVFYEIGMAHVLGKPVILITQTVEDIPFDLRYIRFIQYEFTPRGMSLFENRIKATIKEEFLSNSETLAELGKERQIPWIISYLNDKEPCHCGSGKRFENCHNKH